MGPKSPFEDFLTTLGEEHDESVYGAIERLVQAGEQVGFNGHDLLRMLNGGMKLESLFELIELRMMGASFQTETAAA
jgi:hypothetical protein